MRFALTFVALCLAAVTPSSFAQDGGPRLKPGLWEIKTDMETKRVGPFAVTVERCLDEKSQRGQWHPEQMGPSQKCTKVRSRRDGDAYVVEADCKRGDSAVKTKAVTTVKGDAYTTKVDFTFDPPYRDQTQQTMEIRAKRLGNCPAGMKPGQMRVRDMPAAATAPKK
jgi:hypothetical protein